MKFEANAFRAPVYMRTGTEARVEELASQENMRLVEVHGFPGRKIEIWAPGLCDGVCSFKEDEFLLADFSAKLRSSS